MIPLWPCFFIALLVGLLAFVIGGSLILLAKARKADLAVEPPGHHPHHYLMEEEESKND
jgi:hypothetical protein